MQRMEDFGCLYRSNEVFWGNRLLNRSFSVSQALSYKICLISVEKWTKSVLCISYGKTLKTTSPGHTFQQMPGRLPFQCPLILIQRFGIGKNPLDFHLLWPPWLPGVPGCIFLKSIRVWTPWVTSLGYNSKTNHRTCLKIVFVIPTKSCPN